ncbi:hypothetical protein COU36_04615 [Candidatus Micrarchaeota archaeon CG10_big_fil_rev_8_21_14_0_10_59_7]|nr:MAG: hypothetical protein COU36_04615 [Candidatus Micrarchaeota archaeon CG10_big_fil_rev_8_21_14_0_10_59_7]
MEEAELVGVIVGDGNLWTNNRSYELVISGDVNKERDYFESLAANFRDRYGVSPRIFYRSGALRLVIRNKKLFKHLTDGIGIPIGAGKAEKVEIPAVFGDAGFADFARGFFDTDGSIFFSDKYGSPRYPSVELTTKSGTLARQLQAGLKSMGLSATLHRSESVFEVCLYGTEKVLAWKRKIGSSNPYKIRKFEELSSRCRESV